MTKEEIPMPVWFLEHIEDTLRIKNNINNDKKTGETCQDRNIKQVLNGVRKIFSGEALTGHERLEPLKPYNAKKGLALTWEDMQRIWQIIDIANEECDEHHPSWMYGSKPFFSEVLRRFEEEKKNAKTK